MGEFETNVKRERRAFLALGNAMTAMATPGSGEQAKEHAVEAMELFHVIALRAEKGKLVQYAADLCDIRDAAMTLCRVCYGSDYMGFVEARQVARIKAVS